MPIDPWLKEIALATMAREVRPGRRTPQQALAERGWTHHDDEAHRLLEDLLELLAEQRDQPAVHLRPTVRRLVLDRCFVDDNGDSVVEHDLESILDQEVELLVRVLEQVRLVAIEQGMWCTQPCAPIMFG